MTQVSQMTNDKLVHMDDIDSIAAKLFATLIIMVRGDTSNQNVADLIFSRSLHNARITPYAQNIIMAWVVVADSHNRGRGLSQPGGFSAWRTRLGREWISNQGYILAPQLKARMAKPGYFHRYNFALLKS